MALGRLTLVVGAVIAAVWVATQASSAGATPRPEPPQTRRLVRAGLAVRVEPSDRAYATGHLQRGTEVVVLGERDGWAEIEAPADTFLWVDSDGLRGRDDGSIVAIARRATLRYGVEGADAPGPGHPLGTLPGGMRIREIDEPDLASDDGPKPRTWRAIVPPEGETRFVLVDGLSPREEPADRPRPQPRRGTIPPGEGLLDPALGHAASNLGGEPSIDPPERLASFEPPPDDLAGLPPGVVAELTAIGAEVRAIRTRQVDSWDFEPIRGRYEALLRRFGSDEKVRVVVQDRLTATERDAAASRAARDLGRLLREGDRLDAEVAEARRRLAAAQGRGERAFDATGLLQPSSKRYQGQKVHALIGPEGIAVGYIQIPPGVPVARYMAHRIGVRGVVRYDQGLGARLISARDLEILDKRR